MPHAIEMSNFECTMTLVNEGPDPYQQLLHEKVYVNIAKTCRDPVERVYYSSHIDDTSICYVCGAKTTENDEHSRQLAIKEQNLPNAYPLCSAPYCMSVGFTKRGKRKRTDERAANHKKRKEDAEIQRNALEGA